jgi:hypothetical protein
MFLLRWVADPGRSVPVFLAQVMRDDEVGVLEVLTGTTWVPVLSTSLERL